MIIRLNGPFGAGKTTVARLLLAADPALVLFDTEEIGHLLRPLLAQRVPVRDFQDWRTWRSVTAVTLSALHEEIGADLLVPQTVLVQHYWTEIMAVLADRRIPVRAFTLDVGEAEHRRRIDTDALEPSAAGWRHERRSDYDAARDWLGGATEVIDTTTLAAEQVAAHLRFALGHPGTDPRPTTVR